VRAILALLTAFAPLAAAVVALVAAVVPLATLVLIGSAIVAIAEAAVEAVSAEILALAALVAVGLTALTLAAFVASVLVATVLVATGFAALTLALVARLVAAGQARALARAGAIEALRHGVAVSRLRLLTLPGGRLLALTVGVGLSFRLVLLTVVALLELIERALTGQDVAVIVIGVLEIVLRHDAVAGRRRIAAEHQVLLVNLVGRTAQPDTWAIAVEGLVAALVVMMMVMLLAWLAMLASAPSAHEFNPL
jgi:hypothetical protein